MKNFLENQQFYYVNDKLDLSKLSFDIDHMTVGFMNRAIERIGIDVNSSLTFIEESYDDIESFLGFLRTAYPNIGDLTISNLIRKYSVYFDSSAVLAIDYLPYLCALLVSGATDCSAIGNTTFKKQSSSIIKINSLKLLQMYNGD
jgi:hypothetical protein